MSNPFPFDPLKDEASFRRASRWLFWAVMLRLAFGFAVCAAVGWALWHFGLVP